MKWTISLPPVCSQIIEPKNFFLKDFDSTMVKAFSNKISEAIELEQQILPVYVESIGGDVYALQAVLSLMDSAREKGLKFACITMGHALSAGMIVFSYGDIGLRFLGTSATLMCHSWLCNLGEGKLREQRESIETTLKEEDAIYARVSSHLKGAKNKNWLKKELEKRKDHDWYILPSEAIKHGFADFIGIPTFTMNVKSEFSYSL